jgi:hypothetical protein
MTDGIVHFPLESGTAVRHLSLSPFIWDSSDASDAPGEHWQDWVPVSELLTCWSTGSSWLPHLPEFIL